MRGLQALLLRTSERAAGRAGSSITPLAGRETERERGSPHFGIAALPAFSMSRQAGICPPWSGCLAWLQLTTPGAHCRAWGSGVQVASCAGVGKGDESGASGIIERAVADAPAMLSMHVYLPND